MSEELIKGTEAINIEAMRDGYAIIEFTKIKPTFGGDRAFNVNRIPANYSVINMSVTELKDCLLYTFLCTYR